MLLKKITTSKHQLKIEFNYLCNNEKESLHNMKTHKMTPNQTKILEGMNKVYDKLIEFKKKMNTELVILKDNKITRVKP